MQGFLYSMKSCEVHKSKQRAQTFMAKPLLQLMIFRHETFQLISTLNEDFKFLTKAALRKGHLTSVYWFGQIPVKSVREL